MPKPSLEKAAAFAAVAQRTGGAFVFATRDPSILSLANASAEIAKHSFAEYACKSCGVHHAGVKAEGMAPYCVVCGSDTTELKSTKPSIPSDSEMAYVQCSSCGTHSVMHEAIASIGDAVHCSVCGTSMPTHADLDSDLDPSPSVDDMELVDIDDVEDDLDEQLEMSDSTQDPASDADSGSLGPDLVAPTGTTQELPSDKAGDHLPTDPVTPSNTQQELVASEEVEVDLMDELDEDQDLELSFVYHGTKMSIMHDERIIATLSPERAGDNADMLQTENFRVAVAHTVSTLGLKKAVAQYNFEPKKLKVSLSKVLAKKVEAKVQEQTKTLETARTEVFKDVEQAVAIAAAGFAQNFWRDRVDPLKAAIVAEAKALNVRRPEQFADRIFAAHGIAHLNNVIELAKELIKKPVEARNALAEAIDLSKYKPLVVRAEVEEDVDADDEDDETGTDDEIAAIATSVRLPVTASTTGSPYRTQELRNILGNEPLFN